VGDYFGLEINQTIWKSCMYPPLLELAIFGDSDCNLGKNKIITNQFIENISDSVIINLTKSEEFLSRNNF
jgi:hypothetical protein